MAGRPRTLRLVGIILISLALLIGLYAAVAYLGLQSGRSLREERMQEERAAALSTQLERAREDIEQGNYPLASRRLEWVLEQDAGNSEANALLAQIALETGEDDPEPEPTPDQAASPTPDPEAEGVAPEDAEARSRLQEVEQLLEDDEWEEAITALISLQHAYPDYERRLTDELLYEAYIEQGVELLYGEQIELGLYYLEQAHRLGDLPQDVRDQQQWAELYLAGIGYFGVNWEVTLFYFRDLCLAAPFFHDACARLTEALVAYGDLYAAQMDWCPAVSIYEEAYRQDDSDTITQKLRQARQGCADATPTPTAPITDTTPITQTVPFAPDTNFQIP